MTYLGAESIRFVLVAAIITLVGVSDVAAVRMRRDGDVESQPPRPGPPKRGRGNQNLAAEIEKDEKAAMNEALNVALWYEAAKSDNEAEGKMGYQEIKNAQEHQHVAVDSKGDGKTSATVTDLKPTPTSTERRRARDAAAAAAEEEEEDDEEADSSRVIIKRYIVMRNADKADRYKGDRHVGRASGAVEAAVAARRRSPPTRLTMRSDDDDDQESRRDSTMRRRRRRRRNRRKKTARDGDADDTGIIIQRLQIVRKMDDKKRVDDRWSTMNDDDEILRSARLNELGQLDAVGERHADGLRVKTDDRKTDYDVFLKKKNVDDFFAADDEDFSRLQRDVQTGEAS